MMGSHSSRKHGSSWSSNIRVPKYDLNHFGVITVIFNPVKYKSRYELYHKFDEHMSRSGVTLLTVECIFEASEKLGLPQQKFELTRANDPRHLQIKAPSVLWLKENLINIAVRRLPAYVEYIAWLDADIEFERLDWPHLTIHQLQHYPIVQLFESSAFLGPTGKKKVLRWDHSFAYAIRHQTQIDPRRASECYVHPGYAWAMRRTTFEAMGGLLDFSIHGAGDIHFAYALLNRIDETIPTGVDGDYRRVAQIWGQRVAEVSGNGTLVGYVPINIWHHWHGSRVNRGYFERWSIVEKFHFSPLRDLEKSNQTGLLRLRDEPALGPSEDGKRLAAFEKAIIGYFRSRNEDNIKRPIPGISLSSKNAVKSQLPTHDATYSSDTTLVPYRPTWANDMNRSHQDGGSVYRSVNAGPHPLDITNYSDYSTTLGRPYRRAYVDHDIHGQIVYYDDGDGNDYPYAPGDISF